MRAMKKTAIIADLLFFSFSAFILTLSVLRYFRISLLYSFLFSIVISASIGVLLGLALFSQNKKKALRKADRKERDKLLLHLTLERPERVKEELLKAYLKEEKEAEIREGELFVEGIQIVPLFTLEPVSADSIASAMRKLSPENMYILAKSLSFEAQKLCASFEIKFETEDEVYSLFQKTDTIPNPLICGKLPRQTRRKLAFSKSNSKSFFISGALLLLMSVFSPFPIYYLVSGGCLLAVSIFVRILGFST